MNKENHLYPFGEGYDSYLEYQLSCRQCGKMIHLFLPPVLTHTGYSTDGNHCHTFRYSIDRGVKTLFEHKVIKLRNDTLGNSYLLFDNYHLYPLVPGETAEERKARLIKIKQEELKTCFTSDPEKKAWIIKELVIRNDTVLNALEEVIRVYEKTEREGWKELDHALEVTTMQEDAISVLQRFHVKCQQTTQHIQAEPVSMQGFASFANNMEPSVIVEGKQAEPPQTASQSAVEEWTCSCGTRSCKKFCPACGAPRS